MKPTMVRVTKTSQVEVVQYIDVQVVQSDGDASGPERLAEALVKAQEAAGQIIVWTAKSQEPVRYSRQDYEALPIPQEPEKESDPVKYEPVTVPGWLEPQSN